MIKIKRVNRVVSKILEFGKIFIKDHSVFAIPLLISIFGTMTLLIIWLCFEPFDKVVLLVSCGIMIALFLLDFCYTISSIYQSIMSCLDNDV